MKKILYLLIILISTSVFAQIPPAEFPDGVETKLIQLDTLTTAQKLALPQVKGTVVYDVTLNALQSFDGSSWVSGSGGGSTQDLQSVTDEGATTDNPITISNNGTASVSVHDTGFNRTAYLIPDRLLFSRDGFNFNIKPSTLLGNYDLFIPQLTANDTIALKSELGTAFDPTANQNISGDWNFNGYITIDAVGFTSAPSVGNNKITDMANGTNPNDAVNKSQLDALEYFDVYADSPIAPKFWGGNKTEYYAKFGTGYSHPSTDFVVITDSIPPALTASDIVNVPSGNLAGINVQLALNEIQTELDGVGGLQNLQSVTDEGSTTSNTIIISSVTDKGVAAVQTGVGSTNYNARKIQIYDSANRSFTINSPTITANRTAEWQDKDYTGIADITDIVTTAAGITDFDTEVSNNATVTINSGKISYTDASKVANISVTQAVDLDTMESDIVSNNAKVSYTDAPTAPSNTATFAIGNAGGDRYVASANSATNYVVTITGSKVGAWAKILINAATEPTVNSSAVTITGATFEASTDMYLVTYTDDGTTIDSYLLKK